ncbi:uncharacterized protein VTP21DRAFT_2033 [Calcarisporiella thermophila]|uniref:uncharacterized protein n=1 Tax=Calcarisporiella thermophila TaxID=911321 RepID=UPI0037447439
MANDFNSPVDVIRQLNNRSERDFNYEDSDTFENEINEFYGYLEIPLLLENKKAFDEGFKESWINSPLTERRSHIEFLLEQLELTTAEKRLTAAKKLAYIAHGNFGELKKKEDHISWVIENNKTLRDAGALLSYFHALKVASSVYDHARQTGDSLPSSGRQQIVKEAIMEIGYYLGLIYMLIEVHRGNSNFEEEIMITEPPLICYLFNLLGKLRDRSIKGYPIKKLLPLIWKTMLASFGGTSEADRLKNAARICNGLPPYIDNASIPKSLPNETLNFHNETSLRYPGYSSPPFPPCIPPTLQTYLSSHMHKNDISTQLGNAPLRTRRQNTTSPVVSFPVSLNAPAVPKAVQEAGALLTENMYISTSMWQTIQETELMAKGATQANPSSTSELDPDNPELAADIKKIERVELFYYEILPNLQNILIVLLKLLLATVTGSNNATTNDNSKGSNAIGKSNESVPDKAPNNVDRINPMPEAMIDELETARQREITTKAVSGILLLLLKFTKVNHVLKFEYICQLLVDSNCLLLILKMFGLQDILTTTSANNEIKSMNFFNLCTNNILAKAEVVSGGAQQILSAFLPSNDITQDSTQNETRLQTQTCWRNMFSSINFLRILQKLTKRKTNRILHLMEFKASVILKRILKVSQPMLELYTLKVLRSLVPYLGRKWRQNNMKVITAIFMRCKPELHADDYGTDFDVNEAILQDQRLRTLIKSYNERLYPEVFSMLSYGDQSNTHRSENLLDSSNHYTSYTNNPDDFPSMARKIPTPISIYFYSTDAQPLDEIYLEYDRLEKKLFSLSDPLKLQSSWQSEPFELIEAKLNEYSKIKQIE